MKRAEAQINPLFFWGVITVALSIALILILNSTSLNGGIYLLILVPVAAYLLIMGFFISYISRLAKEKSRWLAKQFEAEQQKTHEFEHLNQELSNYAKQLFDKDFELTLANKRLQTLEQAKSKFVSVTTHQLRTPLSAIKWTFHMLLQQSLGPVNEEQKEFVQKGYDSTQRMITIVNDLLNVDYIQADKSDYRLVPVKLDSLIEGVIFEFTNQTEAKHIKIELNRLSTDLPLVMADPVKLSMVLENLIDNAVKYSPSDGRVVVRIISDMLNSARSRVEVVISDTGIGIPTADREKIFHRFFRAGNAIKVQTDGSGLGLFISKDIIEKHGGEIWFESKEGEGTSFHFTLPVQSSTSQTVGA